MADPDNGCDFNLEEMYNYDTYSPWVRTDQIWLKNIPDYIPKSINYPKLKGLWCLLRNAAKNHPYNCAILYEPDSPLERRYMYKELEHNADKCANMLYNHGVKEGKGVLLFTPNNPEFMFALFGILQTGAAVVPCNPLLKKKEVMHIVSNSEITDTVIVHESLLATIKRVRKTVDIPNIFVIGETREVDPQFMDFNKQVEEAEANPPKITITKEAIAALMYTGGTTGLPKGVMLTHDGCIKNVFQASLDLYDQEKSVSMIGTSANMAVLPLCHIFGLYVSFSTIAGAYLNIMMKFDPSRVLRAIEKYRPFMLGGVPTHWQLLSSAPDFHKRDITNLTLATAAGAALAPAIAKKFDDVGVVVKMGYGLTECSPCTHLQPDWLKYNPESIGIPLVDTDAKIVDPTDFSKEQEIGQAGELLIRGPQTMKGYWRNEEANKRVLLDDGWLRTGDLARIDENGYFYIVGRSKEQIKYKGYRILPFEVESFLFEHEAIADCAVIGVPDDTVGEIIRAYVKLKPEFKGKVTEQEIIAWAKENMAGYKWPRQLEFISSIPKSAVGKTLRRGLREKAIKELQK